MKKIFDAITLLRMRREWGSNDDKRLEKLHYDSASIKKECNIPYSNDKKKSHLLDIYSLEEHSKDTPLIINIHGGGLFYGYKDLNLMFNCELVKRGFKVVSISYGLLPFTTLRGQLKDIVHAFQWIKENSEEYELNIDKLSVVGDSAGALLAYFSTALNNSRELQIALDLESANLKIKTLSLIAIMLNTQRQDFLNKTNLFIASKREKKLKGSKYLLNPIELLEIADFPKTFFNTSTQDDLQNETIVLHELFKEKGIDCILHNWDAGSDYELGHVFPVVFPLYKESIQEIDFMCNFFKENL